MLKPYLLVSLQLVMLHAVMILQLDCVCFSTIICWYVWQDAAQQLLLSILDIREQLLQQQQQQCIAVAKNMEDTEIAVAHPLYEELLGEIAAVLDFIYEDVASSSTSTSSKDVQSSTSIQDPRHGGGAVLSFRHVERLSYALYALEQLALHTGTWTRYRIYILVIKQGCTLFKAYCW
jgi:hypothetical protein